MSRLASWSGPPAEQARHDRGEVWATVVAIVFAALAVISLAVDQSVTLSDLPSTSASAGE